MITWSSRTSCFVRHPVAIHNWTKTQTSWLLFWGYHLVNRPLEEIPCGLGPVVLNGTLVASHITCKQCHLSGPITHGCWEDIMITDSLDSLNYLSMSKALHLFPVHPSNSLHVFSSLIMMSFLFAPLSFCLLFSPT